MKAIQELSGLGHGEFCVRNCQCKGHRSKIRVH
jgi:hypothetical protein